MSNLAKENPDYIYRINKALDFIDQNISEKLSVEKLSEIANFSKFHFNRVFAAFMGETPYQFILRLRLEKAANYLKNSYYHSVSEVAYNSGFTDLAIFSRNFKRHFGISPSKFKQAEFSNFSQIQSNKSKDLLDSEIYFCSIDAKFKWKTKMKFNKQIEVKDIENQTVAYVRNIGPWNGDKGNYTKHRDILFAWAAKENILNKEETKYLILYHDNPHFSESDKLRMSMCLTIEEPMKVEGEIGKMKIESGKYVVARFELTSNDYATAWQWLFNDWIKSNNFEIDQKPYFELYVQPPVDGKFLVDFYVPIK